MIHILVVEDEPIIRQSVVRLLTHAGYEVSEAASVEEVPQSGIAYDLILSDLRLPGQPGTELVNLFPNTPVLVLTSYASVRSAVDAMKLGAVDYIPKPFNHQALLDTVARVLSTQRACEDEASAEEDVSLDAYFQKFVLQNQDEMTETELAKRLGISRKSLWEKRQRFGIPRPKKMAKVD